MTKPTSLETAATLLYGDPRRHLATLLSLEFSSLVADLLQPYEQRFNVKYSSVRGSTYRDTHLLNDLDFDIGLLPVDGCADWNTPLVEFGAKLGGHLASDIQVRKRLSELFGTTPDIVKTSLCNPVQKQVGSAELGQLTILKFRLEDQDRSMIEVSAGTYSWHRVFLDYNAGWDEQLKSLLPDEKDRAISHVCLMKFLAKCCDIYGEKGGGPSSRGYEQLVIRHASKESPIEELMKETLGVDEPRSIEVLYPIPDKNWKEAGLNPKSRNVMRAFSARGWTKFQCLARAVLGDA